MTEPAEQSVREQLRDQRANGQLDPRTVADALEELFAKHDPAPAADDGDQGADDGDQGADDGDQGADAKKTAKKAAK